MSNTPAGYAENYAKLERIAAQLSQQDAVNIDELLPMIDEAMAAYQFCQERINQVESLLQSRLQTQDKKDDVPF